MRDHTNIHLHALPEQIDLIDQAAHALKQDRTAFVLEAACQHAQDVLLDQTFFALEDEKFQSFVAALDAPPRPNLRLERLMAVKTPWV